MLTTEENVAIEMSKTTDKELKVYETGDTKVNASSPLSDNLTFTEINLTTPNDDDTHTVHRSNRGGEYDTYGPIYGTGSKFEIYRFTFLRLCFVLSLLIEPW